MVQEKTFNEADWLCWQSYYAIVQRKEDRLAVMSCPDFTFTLVHRGFYRARPKAKTPRRFVANVSEEWR